MLMDFAKFGFLAILQFGMLSCNSYEQESSLQKITPTKTAASLYKLYPEDRTRIGLVGLNTVGHDQPQYAQKYLIFEERLNHESSRENFSGVVRLFHALPPKLDKNQETFPIIEWLAEKAAVVSTLSSNPISLDSFEVRFIKTLKRKVVLGSDASHPLNGYKALECELVFHLYGQSGLIIQNKIDLETIAVGDLFDQHKKTPNRLVLKPEFKSAQYKWTSCRFNLQPEMGATSVWDINSGTFDKHYVMTFHGGKTSIADLLFTKLLSSVEEFSVFVGGHNLIRKKIGDDNFRILCQQSWKDAEDITCEIIR